MFRKTIERLVQYPVFSAILTVGGLTALVSLASFGRDLLIANRFGVDRVLDAFLIAYLLPLSCVNILAASFTSALMPTYLDVRQNQSVEAGHALFRNCLALGIAFLLGCSALLLLAAPYLFRLLGSGFDAATLELTESLFWVVAPIVPLLGVARLFATVLNAEQRFAAVALSPITTPLLAALFIINLQQQWGIFAFAWGVAAGALAECLLLGYTLAHHRLPLIPRWTGRSPEMNVVLRQYLPMVMGAFLLSGTLIVDQSMASTLNEGSVAALNFGNKPVAFVLSIAAAAIGTSVLPHCSSLLARGEHAAVERLYAKYSVVIFAASAPPAALIAFFAEDLIALVFEHGKFDTNDTKVVALVLAYYCIQVPFYLLGTLSVRLLSAYKANQVLMYVSGFGLVANTLMNLVFMRWLGVPGIALSTSAVYLMTFLACRWVLQTKFRDASAPPTASTLL